MRLAIDLHTHSRYAAKVSKEMTVEGIACWAQWKGLDLLGTGDCLQEDWLNEIEAATDELEAGIFALKSGVEEKVSRRVGANLRRPLRYVLSTEVSCAPEIGKEMEGLHHLIYFPSIERARSFREVVEPFGDLRQGRPTFSLNSVQLLELVLQHGADCHLAPAHVFNPWFSALGTIAGGYSLDDIFGDLRWQLLAVETGLTSTPGMCRRVSSLDHLALFSSSDAHSLPKLGREYTLVDIEPSYQNLFSALREGKTRHIVRTVKFPLYRTRYFLNWCSRCQATFDAKVCPVCRRPLVEGSRARLEKIADRREPCFAEDAPPFCELLPLIDLLAQLAGCNRESGDVNRLYHHLLATVGNERAILTEATEDEIREATTPQLARAIVAQRSSSTESFLRAEPPPPKATDAEQSFFQLS